jgi:hypothetical protein
MAGPIDRTDDEVLLDKIRSVQQANSLRHISTHGELLIAEALALILQQLVCLTAELKALKEGWPNGSY